jgi:transposase
MALKKAVKPPILNPVRAPDQALSRGAITPRIGGANRPKSDTVVLPLELGLSMEQTARMLGVSVGWACQLRTRFIRNGGRLDEDGPRRGGRRRENLSPEEEAAFLAPFLEQAKAGKILVVSEIIHRRGHTYIDGVMS